MVETNSCMCTALTCNNFKSSQNCVVFYDNLDSKCETNNGIMQAKPQGPLFPTVQALQPTAGNDKTPSKPDTVVTVTVVVVAVVAVLVISGVVVGALLLRRKVHKLEEEIDLVEKTPKTTASYSATSTETDAQSATK